MKRFVLVFVLLGPAAYAISPVGILPEDKAPVVVAESERNPFGKKPVKLETVEEDVEDEESKIRNVIEKLPISGVMQGRTGTKVLLGTLVVEEGRMLPPVIPRQQEKIKVMSVSAEKVELAFVEPSGETGLRKVMITLDVRPKIQFRLNKPAQEAPEVEEKPFDGVITKDDLGAAR